jgi:hypothetical protein
MNCVLCVGHSVDVCNLSTECGGVLDIYSQHLDRDQVDTPELCSNTSRVSTTRAGILKTSYCSSPASYSSYLLLH